MSEDSIQDGDIAALEEKFLAGLSAPAIPFGEMRDTLIRLRSAGRTETADEWAELLQDALRAGEDIENGLDILEMRCSWHASDPSFKGACLKCAAGILEKLPSGAAFVESAGFGSVSVPTAECMSRLRLLLHLKPGLLCAEKTWGFGIIRRIDGFYRKVSVDFESKKEHELSFEYAAQVLRLISPDHILAVRHSDPARLARLVKEDPAEVARMALRSCGPMNAVQLQEFLTAKVLPADGWKSFWDAARKGLKSDPFVNFPSKRTDPITLRTKEKAFDDEWFLNLSVERGLDRVVELIEEFAGSDGARSAGAAERTALANRTAFVLKGAAGNRPDLVARALMAAHAMEMGDVPGFAEAEAQTFSPAGLTAVSSALPSSKMRRFLSYMTVRLGGEATSSLLTGMITGMPLPFLNETISYFSDLGRDKHVEAAFRKAILERTASLEMLYWINKKQQDADDSAYGSLQEALRQVFERMQGALHGEKLRMARLFRELFERRDWLERVLGRMDNEERSEFVIHVRDCVAWPQLDRNSVLVRIVSLHPDLERLLSTQATAGGKTQAAAPTGRFTSWRSYNERKRRLEQIVNVELPKNGRDLAQARAYGDLSENHEFKAAKERQAMLVNQRDTIAEEMKTVKGTDFEGFPCAAAGPGTSVILEMKDGSKIEYFILGEWDGDPERRILSSRSALASALSGLGAGQEAVIPDPHSAGTATCRIAAVAPLPDDIKAHAKNTE